MNNPEYIKFVISRVESDFAGYSSGSEYLKVISILSSLKSADNILREAFVLSGIKKLRRLAFYIIFMYKKIESNRITLDNFLENFKTDKEYLERYLQAYYNLEGPEEPQAEDTVTEKYIIEGLQDPGAEEDVYSLTESTFRIESLESKLVNEEFIESNPLSNMEIADDGYMRLVEQESAIEPAAGTEHTPEEGDVFSLPVNIPLAKTGKTGFPEKEGDTAPGTETQDKNLADFFEELDKKSASAQEELNLEEKEQIIQKLQEEYREQIKDVIITEDVYGEASEENRADDIPDHEPAEEKIIVPETDTEVESKLKEIELETSQELINSEFTEYETDLYTKNDRIRGIFDELITIANDKSPDYNRRDVLLKDLCDTAWYLKEKSGTMTFEIITRIYDSVIFCFSQKFKEIVVTDETISVFREAINGVEKLVRGDELGNFSVTIKKVENVENELRQMLELREEYEKKKYDFGEEERKIIEDFKDNSEKEAYLHLRDRILALEKIFDAHIEMKDKIHPFESIRKLSSSFAIFREVVNVSGILEMTKMARLAEAGYVFVKFIQNYRIDPFKEDVMEVFRFMIYSFKLIYLDKPVKELEVFISYLNDPVKIFHQKKQTE